MGLYRKATEAEKRAKVVEFVQAVDEARGVTQASGVTQSGVTAKRKGDRHKPNQAAYMRAYRARKKAEKAGVTP